MRRAAYFILAVLSASGAILFAFAYYERYWRWRDCFNELGRCYDPESEQVFVEQAGLVWGAFTIACLLVFLLSVSLMFRRRRAG